MPQITRLDRITRQFVRDNPLTVFVFEDNLQERGFGGQAAAMRGELNSVGIPTKHAPDRRPSSYFSDADFPRVKPWIDQAFDRLELRLKQGHKIVIPTTGIGTGLADLPFRAPKIHDYIQQRFAQLENQSRATTPTGLQDLIKLRPSR